MKTWNFYVSFVLRANKKRMKSSRCEESPLAHDYGAFSCAVRFR